MFVNPLKNSLQSALVILIMSSLAFIGLYLWGAESDLSENLLYPQHLLYNFLDFRLHSFWLIQLINILIILIGAFLVNFIAIQQEIINKNNFIPAFLYMLMGFSETSHALVHPALLANLFVLTGLYYYFKTYRADRALSDIFLASFFIGWAPFFYTNDLTLLILCFISITILRSFYWREWVMVFIGFLLPLYLYMSISYLTNHEMFRILAVFQQTISSFHKPVISEYHYPLLFFIILSMLFSLFSYLRKGFGSKVKTQKFKYILLWMLLFSLMNTVLDSNYDFIFVAATIPLSIIIGDYLAEIKQMKISNTILFLLIAGYLIIYLHHFEWI